MPTPRPIYHLAPDSELRAGIAETKYAPHRLPEDGFVHCSAGADVTLAVANDYYGELPEPLLLLALDPARLTPELRFEAPAPIAGGGRAHLEEATRFPHLYGPVDLAAITGVAVLEREAQGYRWPPSFEPLDRALARAATQKSGSPKRSA